MFNGDYINFYKGLLNENTVYADSSNQADTIKVTSNGENTSLYVPLFKVGSTGYKALLFDVNNQFYYNPSTSTLTAYNLTVSNSLNFPLGSIDGSIITNYSIALNKLMTSIYATLSTPNTLMFRDSTGSANIHDMTVDGILTATADPLSTVSRSNTTFCHSDSGNQEFYIVGTPNISSSDYYELHGDLSGNISFNPNTHRLTTGFLRCTDTALSTMEGGLTVSGLFTGTNNASSTVTRSNKINTTASTTNTIFPIPFSTTGSGYKDLLNSTTLSYNPSLQTLYSTGGNNAQGAPYSLWLGQASSTKSAQAVFIDGFSSNQYAQLYCRNNVFGIQGNITSISLEKQINATQGLTVSGLFTGTNNASSVVSNSNAVYTVGVTTGSYYVPLISTTGGTGYRNLYNKSSITYDMTNDIFQSGKATFSLGDWQTDDPSLTLGTANGNNEGVLEMICSATQSYLLEVTPAGNMELYLKSGTPSMYYQITPTIFNVYASMNISTGNMYKINNVDLNTDNIQESGTPTNLYFTNLRARSSIIPTDTSEIDHTYSTSTGILTSDIKALSIANGKLTNSSITLGSTAMSLGSTITTVAGMTSITTSTISSTTQSSGTIEARNGGANLITPSSATASAFIGQATTTNGVIFVNSQSGTISSYGSVIQQFGGNLYIDNTATANTINIGTISTNTVNIKSLNIQSGLQYNLAKYSNIGVKRITACNHSVAIGVTLWYVISNTATSNVLQASFTARQTGSFARVTVNISLVNWGTGVANNRNVSISKSVGTAWVTGNTSGFEVTGGSPYGLVLTLSGIQYQDYHFSYIDDFATSGTVAGTTYYYAVVARCTSNATVSSNFGNSAYCDITVEELF